MPPQSPGGMLKPHRGTVILVLGILGLVVCGICGIVAWVMGNADLREMDAGLMDPAGRGTTQAGKILGMISVGLMALGIVLWLVMMVIGLGAAAAGAAGNGP
ncbi:MAG: DUF4190 domain-containing protein [Leptolyngbya sp. PLA1]|nr:DUF4190 domain-containing protein [Leptolyngbya sp. PLA1]